MRKNLPNPWLFCTLLSAAMLLATPSSYADTKSKAENAEQQADKIESEKKDQRKKICKRVKVTGSQIRKSICNTQAGWRELENRSQESIRGMNRGPSVGGSISN